MAGYSGVPLAKKLGIVAGVVVHAIAAPAHYRSLLAPLPAGVRFVSRMSAEVGVVHLFSTRRAHLQRVLVSTLAQLRPSAMIWVSWPKKSSGVASEIVEETIRELALPLGLVDVKVCAIDEVWSGLKLVIRKSRR